MKSGHARIAALRFVPYSGTALPGGGGCAPHRGMATQGWSPDLGQGLAGLQGGRGVRSRDSPLLQGSHGVHCAQPLKKDVGTFANVPPKALFRTRDLVKPNLPKSAHTLPLVLWIQTSP